MNFTRDFSSFDFIKVVNLNMLHKDYVIEDHLLKFDIRDQKKLNLLLGMKYNYFYYLLFIILILFIFLLFFSILLFDLYLFYLIYILIILNIIFINNI